MSRSESQGIRSDGATRGDRNEAIAILVGGVVLLAFLPVVLVDRLAQGWLWFGVLLGVGGVVVLAFGLRWFLVEGPRLARIPAEESQGAAGSASLPREVKLVEGRNRLRAHVLRCTALGSGLVLLLGIDIGVFKWVVVALFLVSFVADHILLRPRKYRLDERGIAGVGLLTRGELRWDAVERLYWRHYPGVLRPPFPSGDRVIIEMIDGDDVEFVFSKRYGEPEARAAIVATAGVLGDRLTLLQPQTRERAEVSSPDISELVSSGRLGSVVPDLGSEDGGVIPPEGATDVDRDEA
ncbi:MAG: hypothetical protein VX498_06415 [Myxococcota bacterium]|nr:hypothetical protein [Myxococcota bacterium]